MMPGDYDAFIAAARGRTGLSFLCDRVSPHATLLCWREILESGQVVICGAVLEHHTAGGYTLTVCPRCDRYDERSDQ